MPILLTLLIFAVILGFAIFLVRATMLWTLNQARHQFENRFHAAETIVNLKQVPEDWISAYRQRIEKIKDRGGNQSEIESQGKKAQGFCLKQMKSLIKFLQNGNFYDDDDTRFMVMDTLQAQYNLWLKSSWEIIFEAKPQTESEPMVVLPNES
jgi:hypothetical protein